MVITVPIRDYDIRVRSSFLDYDYYNSAYARNDLRVFPTVKERGAILKKKTQHARAE